MAEVMKSSFHNRAFYCYLLMSIWIFILIAVTYKYVFTGEDIARPSKNEQKIHISKTDLKYRKIYIQACNPPEGIVRRSEGNLDSKTSCNRNTYCDEKNLNKIGLVDNDSWLLQGVLVVTRHGDRGPLTHLRGGDRLPCDTVPSSPLLKSYEEFARNSSAGGRAWWVAGAGPFHNFPSLPARGAATSCALGQLTWQGLLQMITVGNIFREAYGDKLGLDFVEPVGKKDTGQFVSYSTRYRRTYQSLAGTWWGVARGAAGSLAAAARESHTVAFCFRSCVCLAHRALTKKVNAQAKNRLESHPAIKDLVNRLSKVLFESQEYTDADVVRDALMAYMCHDVPLPCSETSKDDPKSNRKKNKKRPKNVVSRNLFDTDVDTLNIELDYVNNNLDFNNEIGRKARDIIGKNYDIKDKQKVLDFDAQMEREKLLYYQQRYLDNADAYDDVEIVKKNLDADFNFPNDARMDTDFDEEYKEPTANNPEGFCIKKEHIISLFAYLEWTYKQEIRNIHNRRRGLLIAYGLIHNIVQNMIRIISENRPKFMLYSGHDKTLQALTLALGLSNYEYYSIQYASRMIFEVYRRKDLRDEFKFTKRKAIAQDFYFRILYNGDDVTNKLTFCRPRHNIVMKVVDPLDDMRIFNTYLCPIENIVRFIHDDYFSVFNASNYKDACAIYGNGKNDF